MYQALEKLSVIWCTFFLILVFSETLYIRFYARCFSLSLFNAFSKRSTAAQSWVFAHSDSSFKPSWRLMLGLKFSSFCALLVSAWQWLMSPFRRLMLSGVGWVGFEHEGAGEHVGV